MTDFIAIDGPAGSGKSSVSKAVARTLGFGYLDTGSAYRALAWHVLDQGADTEDPETVRAAASAFPLTLGLDPDERTVLVGDVDVTEAIRDPRVSGAVSGVARVPEVRAQVNEMFRRLVAESSYPAVVVEGRGVLADADLVPHAGEHRDELRGPCGGIHHVVAGGVREVGVGAIAQRQIDALARGPLQGGEQLREVHRRLRTRRAGTERG